MKESPLSADERSCDGHDDDGRWIARTVQPALAYAITLVRNRHDAEDIVQECYRKLLARADHYDLPRDGAKLLYRSITNACINHVQRRPPVTTVDSLGEVPFPPQAHDGRPPEARLIEQELELAIEQSLAELPVNQRAVLELASLGYALIDVAEMLDLNHSHVRVLLHRARQSVAGRLKMFHEEKSGE